LLLIKQRQELKEVFQGKKFIKDKLLLKKITVFLDF